MVFFDYKDSKVLIIRRHKGMLNHLSPVSIGVYRNILLFERAREIKGVLLPPDNHCYRIIFSNIDEEFPENALNLEDRFRVLGIPTFSSIHFRGHSGELLDEVHTGDISEKFSYKGITYHDVLTAVLMSPRALPHVFFEYLMKNAVSGN